MELVCAKILKKASVFDMAPSSFMQWQFLGSCAFEVDIDSPEYKAICDRYEDENGKPKNINAGLYILEYEFAQKLNEERNKMWENEFGDDE
jgi:hypothetical protein